MRFRFTDEQAMIRDSAAAALAEISNSAAVRAAMATELGYDPALWRRICADLRWQAAHIPERYGGLGLGYVELVALQEQMGRHLLCSPFFATVCLAANALLVAASEEQKARHLPRLVAGRTATLAWRERAGAWDASGVSGSYRRSGAGYVLNGEYRYVIDGHSAQLLIVAARRERGAGALALFALPADTPGVARHWLPTMDQTRKQARLSLSEARVDAEARLGGDRDMAGALERTLQLAAIALAGEQVGGAQQALDISVGHVQEREQFGRAIASYQAVKHKAADMMLQVETGRSAVYYAACVADEALRGGAAGAGLAEAASVAKSWCGDAYFFNAGCGIQLHGGAGCTWEHDIQLHFKRAGSSSALLGGPAEHRERLAAALLD